MRNMLAQIASSGSNLGLIVLAAAFGSSTSMPVHAGGFTAGNIVVLQIGTGSNVLMLRSVACFLQEYTTNGNLVQTIPLPVSSTDANYPLTLYIGSTTPREGILKRSVDGRYLTFGGYGVNPGFQDPAASNPVVSPRVVGRVDWSRNINTTTALTNSPVPTPPPNGSSYHMVSAISTDGSRIWIAGSVRGCCTELLSQDVRYATLGSQTFTAVATNVNTRAVNIFNNQLYVSTAASPRFGVATVGTGLPTSSIGGAPSLLPGFPTSGIHSSYDFWFSDDTTLYVADSGNAGTGGGIQKWRFSEGQWLLQYILLNNGTTNMPVYAMTGTMDGNSNAVLYATSGANFDNKLITLTDKGADSVATVIADAPTNTAFRGVAFAPVAGIAGPKLTGVIITGNDLRLNWDTTGGTTNFVQASGSLSSGSFSDISGPIYIPGGSPATTNYTETNGANNPARYYQIRSVSEE